MSYRLFVRPVPPFADLDQNPESQLFSWLLQDASGDTQASGAADTRDAIEQTLGQNALEKVLLIGLIPGDEALFCLADIPAKQSRFVHQALPTRWKNRLPRTSRAFTWRLAVILRMDTMSRQ